MRFPLVRITPRERLSGPLGVRHIAASAEPLEFNLECLKEATARIKINKLLEAAGWRFFAAG
jgi:hypothetical protein